MYSIICAGDNTIENFKCGNPVIINLGLVFAIRRSPTYRKTLRFFEISSETVKESFKRNLLKEVKF